MTTSPTLQLAFGAKPPFIKLTPNGFHIDDHDHPRIDFKIHDYTFMRKLFSAGRLTCYSMDATTAPDGKCCALCTWNYTCTKVIRLMIMLESHGGPHPAIFDVNSASFETLAPILDQLPKDHLHDTLITANVTQTARGIAINFKAIF